MAKRPEHTGPPELFYDEKEARKYSDNSRMMEIQATMTERAVELLALGEEDGPALLLDIGCGSGLSGDVITEMGHFWVGIDVAPAMLKGLLFRPGSFDGAVSISALQWLCNAESREQSVPKRLRRLFTAVYAGLKRGGRAVFQFYPENSAQVELVTTAAMKCGFTGGLVVDFPNSSKAKKVFLVLSAGGSQALPRPITDDANTVSNAPRGGFQSSKSGKPSKTSKAWIQARKDRDRKKGRLGLHPAFMVLNLKIEGRATGFQVHGEKTTPALIYFSGKMSRKCLKIA